MASDKQDRLSGYFSNLDSIHVHVDGGGDSAPVNYIVEQLKKQGAFGKTTPIQAAVEGLQRQEPWAIGTYESHTPGPVGQELLEFFSTSLLSHDLRNMRGAIQRLNQVLSILSEQQSSMPQGIVVEVERVIAKGEDKIIWSEVPVDESFVIHSPDAGFGRSRTADIEIHYAFDIPKAGRYQNTAPMELRDLKAACEELNIRVGGWFFFDKGDRWAYRSNQFAKVDMPREIPQQQRDKLQDYLSRKGNHLGFECKVRALIEQVLGVWRTPLTPVDTRRRKSTRQLAEWEASLDLEEFWVIAPNFLGDTHGDVRQAMIRNLRHRVMYTYFLRSFADVQRLRRLAETLEADVRGPADVYKQIRAVLLESISDTARDVFDEEYFIANPNAPNREGYRLLRNVKGDIYEGELMTSVDFQKADLLLDLIKHRQITHWMHIPLRRDSDRSKQSAIVCARVENVPDKESKLNEQKRETILNEFDQVIAATVSKLCGQVVKGAIASYFIIFDDVKPALDCAIRLQKGVKDYNDILTAVRIPSPRITLDFGHVNRVMRSYGFDFVGQPISVCAKLVDQINDGEIFLTRAVEDNLPPASRSPYKFSNLSPRPLEEFGNVQVKKLDWE